MTRLFGGVKLWWVGLRGIFKQVRNQRVEGLFPLGFSTVERRQLFKDFGLEAWHNILRFLSDNGIVKEPDSIGCIKLAGMRVGSSEEDAHLIHQIEELCVGGVRGETQKFFFGRGIVIVVFDGYDQPFRFIIQGHEIDD